MGLEEIGVSTFAVSSSAGLRGPGQSRLVLLAGRLQNGLLLLDPRGGSRGVSRQLSELVETLGVDQIRVVDVGGAILARGAEPGLRSPIADSVVLSASSHLDAPVDLIVLGPGLDGELTTVELEERLAGSPPAGNLTAEAVRPYLPPVESIPSDANVLLLAAAMGLRGVAEVRDAGLPLTIDDASACFWILDAAQVASQSRLAEAVSETHDLAGLEAAVLGLGLDSEIDFERRKARRNADSPLLERLEPGPALNELDAYSASARDRGIDVLTLRRIGEVLRLAWPVSQQLARFLQQERPAQYRHGIWRAHR